MLPSPTEMVVRLLIGAVLGGVVGYERQVHGRSAGFRTMMLVCLASVLLMELSSYQYFRSLGDPNAIRIDPARIAAGAITGIGFLGAGVIVKLGASVQGLTTAAALWVVAAIGMTLGAGMYLEAGATFLITLSTLLVLRVVEHVLPRVTYKILTIGSTEALDESAIRAILHKHGANVIGIDYERDMRTGTEGYRFTIAIHRRPTHAAPFKSIADEIARLPGIGSVSISGQ